MTFLAKNKHSASQSGQILLLLLLIMSMALVVALGLIQLTLTQKTTVRYEDFSMRAYYAAEAGLEDAIPRLEQLSDLAGAAVDERMRNPAYGLTVLTPAVLGGDAEYSYTRSVGRENVWILERSIDEKTTSQFDISDTGDVSLENSVLEIAWEDLADTCDTSGYCNTAIEATLVWEIPATTNLMPNPSFEDDGNSDGVADIKAGQSWNKINGTDKVTMNGVYSRYGSFSQRIEDTSNTTSAGIVLAQSSGNLIQVDPDTTYTLSVYVYIESLSGGYVRLDAAVWDVGKSSTGHSTFVRARQLNQTTGIYWERLFYTFTTTANARYLQPFLYMDNPAVGVVYADGIQLEKQSIVTAYCDGEGTPARGTWDGPGAPPFSPSSRNGSYAMTRELFDIRPDPVCDPSLSPPGPCFNSYIKSSDWHPAPDKRVRVTLDVDQASSNRALRLKNMFGPVQVSIRARSETWPSVTYKLVGQEITITSTGYFANTKKTLEVQHGLPSMMPQFDYVLYNYGCADEACIPRDLIK